MHVDTGAGLPVPHIINSFITDGSHIGFIECNYFTLCQYYIIIQTHLSTLDPSVSPVVNSPRRVQEALMEPLKKERDSG